MDNTIVHYGTPRKSGRYPWGSGGEKTEALQRLEAKGLSEGEIASALGVSTTVLRNQKAIIDAELREAQRLNVIRQKESGMSVSAISKEFGIPESTIRDLLRPHANMKYRIIKQIADVLRKLVKDKQYVDIGDGVEVLMGVSKTKLNNAVTLLTNEGYTIHYLRQEQLGNPGKKTSVKVLAAPGVEWPEVNANKSKIAIPHVTFDDDDNVVFVPEDIRNVSSKRVLVKYANDGGGDKDGLIELRRGVPELNLGDKAYAQVRIGVDGTHFMKGMAVLRDDLPPGVDIVYNTSKLPTGNKLDAMKPQKSGDDALISQFGSVVIPNTFTENGVTKAGAVNIIGEKKLSAEGGWSDWSKSLASQVLSKQSPDIADRQLQLTRDGYKLELDEISSLTNPTVRNQLLIDLADKADRAAVDLKAAALPRQTTNVILPDPKLKPTEIYAPNYNNGESVVLIRYPHGGVFEIPTLTVNNKTSQYRDIIGTAAKDAVAIHPEVAQKLSGADFDGDFVLVIPNKNKVIRTEPSLEQLKNFDPKREYPYYDGMKVLSEQQKQRAMGDVSNLITDMTIKGASTSEIARAVRHSMVVIDATKHELNHEQSYRDNGIAALKKTYQGSARSGAATLISRARSQQRVPARFDHYDIDPVTGKKVYTYTEETYVDRKTGNIVPKTQRSYKMLDTVKVGPDGKKVVVDTDPYDLSSGTVIEKVYAKHASEIKALANEARKRTLEQTPTEYSKTARETYRDEVSSLDRKYKAAVASRPVQRKTQLLGAEIYARKLAMNPGMTPGEKRKEKGRSLVQAQRHLDSKKPVIDLTPREWQAIEMGAVSPTRLKGILRHADMDQVRAYATPRSATPGLSTGKVTRAKSLINAGYTAAEVAASLGVPVSQIRDIDKK